MLFYFFILTIFTDFAFCYHFNLLLPSIWDLVTFHQLVACRAITPKPGQVPLILDSVKLSSMNSSTNYHLDHHLVASVAEAEPISCEQRKCPGFLSCQIICIVKFVFNLNSSAGLVSTIITVIIVTSVKKSQSPFAHFLP